ncbi:MAG: hypothetical protein JXA89_16150 [Anaerolineae bacterium]|nr:hypothetical protein [Anaerolineae bacterium]
MSEASFLHHAITAVRAGRKAEARKILDRILQDNPDHEQAWLWMSAVVETKQERVRCLEQVLAINPNNATARKGLVDLGGNTGAPTPEPSQPDLASPDGPALAEEIRVPEQTAQCVHCGTNNPVQASFCGGCGQKIKDEGVPQASPPAPVQEERTAQRASKNRQRKGVHILAYKHQRTDKIVSQMVKIANTIRIAIMISYAVLLGGPLAAVGALLLDEGGVVVGLVLGGGLGTYLGYTVASLFTVGIEWMAQLLVAQGEIVDALKAK